jgi:hypothetical protein
MAPVKQAALIAAAISYVLINRPSYRYLIGGPSYAGDFIQLLMLQFCGYVFYLVMLYPKYFSPLRHLPGPKVRRETFILKRSLSDVIHVHRAIICSWVNITN